MKTVLTDKMFEDAGYKEFGRGPLDNDHIEKHYQKRFDDKTGKKYFITANKWMAWKHPSTGEKIPENYEFEIQLSDKETDNPVNILLFGGWTLEAVEKRAEELWAMGCWRYYETWDEC